MTRFPTAFRAIAPVARLQTAASNTNSHAPMSNLPAARRGVSLKLRLALSGALLIAAAVALTVGLTTRTASRHAEQWVLDQSKSQTRRLAGFLSARLVNLQLALRAAGERLDVSQALDPAIAARYLEEQAGLTTQVHTLFVAEPSGRMLALWDAKKGVYDPGISIADRPYFQQTLAQQRPLISPPIMGRVAAEPIVVLTMPVRNATGQIVAVIGGSIRLATPQWLPHLAGAVEDDLSVVVIVDAQGRVMTHPEPQWLLRDAAHVPGLAGAVAAWTAQGRPAEPEGDAGHFDSQFVAWAGVPDAEWVVFQMLPDAVALSGLQAARREAIGLGLAVALGGGLVLAAITLLLLRPLRRLGASASALAGGAPVESLSWPRSGGEIGDLADVLRQALEARSRSESEQRVLLARLQAVMQHAPVGFSFTRERRFEMVSAYFERLFGQPPGALDGQPASTIYASDEVYAALGARVGEAFAAQRPFDGELEFARRDGQRFWGRLRGQPVAWDDPQAGTIWTLEDVSAERAMRESLAWTSTHDALTGLSNRAELERRLGAALGDRRGGPTSALFIDLDRFKAVNDAAGHAAGDAVLKAVAAALQAQVRNDDLVARLGGDEFAVLLRACDRHGALRVAEKMRAAVAALRVPWAGRELDVGSSIGAVEVDGSFTSIEAVLDAADAACYAAKHSGRDCVRVHGIAQLRVV
jgi:diguanylate cyclase (GGDEF)-like protein/PAS domain S-box-containing protein